MIEASAELTGNDGEAFAVMDAVVKVKPIDKFQPYAGLKLSFADAPTPSRVRMWAWPASWAAPRCPWAT